MILLREEKGLGTIKARTGLKKLRSTLGQARRYGPFRTVSPQAPIVPVKLVPPRRRRW